LRNWALQGLRVEMMSEKASLEGLPPGAGEDGRIGMFVENVLDRQMGVGAGDRVAIVYD